MARKVIVHTYHNLHFVLKSMITSRRALPYVVTAMIAAILSALATYMIVGSFGPDNYRVRYYVELVKSLDKAVELKSPLGVEESLHQLRRGLRSGRITSDELRRELPASPLDGDRWLADYEKALQKK